MLLAQAALADEPMAPTPMVNPGNWVTPDDYPVQARRDGAEGVVDFVLQISKNGVVTACDVAISSGYSALDLATCGLLKLRARFIPARDKRGAFVVGEYRNSVRWVLPKDEPEKFALFAASISFTIDKQGYAYDCKLDAPEGTPAGVFGEVNPCNSRNQRFKPFVDKAGHPVTRRVKLSFKSELLDE